MLSNIVLNKLKLAHFSFNIVVTLLGEGIDFSKKLVKQQATPNHLTQHAGIIYKRLTCQPGTAYLATFCRLELAISKIVVKLESIHFGSFVIGNVCNLIAT